MSRWLYAIDSNYGASPYCTAICDASSTGIHIHSLRESCSFPLLSSYNHYLFRHRRDPECHYSAALICLLLFNCLLIMTFIPLYPLLATALAFLGRCTLFQTRSAERHDTVASISPGMGLRLEHVGASAALYSRELDWRCCASRVTTWWSHGGTRVSKHSHEDTRCQSTKLKTKTVSGQEQPRGTKATFQGAGGPTSRFIHTNML